MSTADHGMNAKSEGAGETQVVFLQDLLDREPGAGAAVRQGRGRRTGMGASSAGVETDHGCMGR
ncbi:hypothetical protein ACH4SK_30465 [Streptomyces inhibens]|uniref:hypothetical protein n=1 Tax=Streptomyces inhibens TaxID=2293571 RepID=UPI00379EC50A